MTPETSTPGARSSSAHAAPPVIDSPRAKPGDGFFELTGRWIAAFRRSRRLAAPAFLEERPFVGSLLQFRRDRLRMLEHAAALGPVVGARFGPMPVLILSEPELIREVFVARAKDSLQAPALRGTGEPLLGQGLLTAEGDAHKRQRKLLAPAFTPKRITVYGERMAENVQRYVARWKDGEELDAASEMMQLTLGIAARVLFDTDIEQDARAFGEALGKAMHQVVSLSNAILPIPPHWPTPGQIKMRRAIATLDKTAMRIIDERRREDRDRHDVLSMLLAARDDDGSKMSDRHLRDEVMTLLLAGHETTSNLLSWSLYRLAEHPCIRERAEVEVDRVLGDRPITLADVGDLETIERILKEALRVHPSVYAIGRYSQADFEFKSVNAFAPAGSLLLGNVYGMHRSGRFFDDPLRFDPDRHTPDDARRFDKLAYIPFGMGPRTCIGNHFAMLEAKIALAEIVRSARLDRTTRGPIHGETDITMRPKGGLPVRVRRRR